ncbi:hypothetical protein BB558_000376 [Smittium angustum]|uniref:PQ-loop repeat-containing protein n=1 Tax=Smittium angustum TaxID=133377 RepID=A0A2U1JEK8_SMIAN|nr:hypothetical protein BB558_000376 [Smittium angustum]
MFSTDVFYKFLELDPEKCQIIPGPGMIRTSILMIVGTYLSYTPQIYKIIKNKTSYGISPYFILLGSLGAISNIFNYLILNYWLFDCCQVLSLSSCFKKTLGVFLIGAQTIQFLTIFMLFIIYFPRESKYRREIDSPTESPENSQVYRSGQSSSSHVSLTNPQALLKDKSGFSVIKFLGLDKNYTVEYETALLVTFSIITYFTFCLLVTTLFGETVGFYSVYIRTWAKILGIFSLSVTIVQFIPQIAKTIKLKHVGSLSIPMMMIQTPGGFMFVYIIASQQDSNWTSWVSTFSAAVFQGVLLITCLILQYKDSHSSVSAGTSTSPLLGHSESEEQNDIPVKKNRYRTFG